MLADYYVMDNVGGLAVEHRRDRVGLFRVIGLATIVGLFVFSVSWFLQLTSSDTTSSTVPDWVSDWVPDAVSTTDLIVAGDDPVEEPGATRQPSYLALRVAPSSGIFNVDRLRQDGGHSETSVPEIDLSLESDLFPPYSLAVRPSIGPGLYATRFGVQNCSFELRRLQADGEEAIIGHDHLNEGRMLATVNDIEADVFDPSWSCGEWSTWSPLAKPLETAGSGDYWRSDLLVGNWTVSRGCEWEKVVGFRGADLADVQDSGVGPGQLTIDDSTLGLRVRRCPGGLSWRQPLVPQEDE